MDKAEDDGMSLESTPRSQCLGSCPGTSPPYSIYMNTRLHAYGSIGKYPIMRDNLQATPRIDPQ